MATNSRQARRDVERKRKQYKDDYVSTFSMLFHNSVIVENLPENLPKRYLLRVLKNKGAIAYDKITGLFLPFTKQGFDAYGLPLRYTLIGYNGLVLQRNTNEVVILRANDIEYPISDYLEFQAQKLVDIDVAIEQNLEAVKTMTIYEVGNAATLLSIANEAECKRIGSTVFFRSRGTNIQNDCKVSNTGAEYIVDKLIEARKEVFNETLSALGINTANTEKRERVQTAEIRASNGYSIDRLNTLIQTFNEDSEKGGLSIRLKANTNLLIYNEIELENSKKGEESI